MDSTADATLIGAGDVGVCGTGNDRATGDLIENTPGAVFMAGDGAYPNGTPRDFANCYDPVWGKFKDRTYPVAGNHEWKTTGAGGYFGYFGEQAGSPTKDWYSIDLGAWQIVVLDSACVRVGGCGSDSPQGRWLVQYLAGLDPSRCLMAIWHHPRWASFGNHGDDDRTSFYWETLYAAGAEVVVNAHEHFYERLEPLDPTGLPDPATGIREFVVGTGGTTLTDITRVRPYSVVRDTETHGVIKFTLQPNSYEWEFLPVEGKTFTDQGSAECHGAA